MTIQRSLLAGLAASLTFLTLGASPALAAPPEAATVAVEEPTKANEAVLHGVLNPNNPGEAGEYQFLYKASEAKACKGGSTIPTPAGVYGAGQGEPVSAELQNLIPDTEYAVCVRAENEAGEVTVGPAVTFKTAEASAPIIESQSAGEVRDTTATINATINPGGLATTCEVQYGQKDIVEAAPVPCPHELEAGDTAQSVAVQLSGLKSKTEYHFRFVATNEKGTQPATEQGAFTSGPKPPVAVTGEEATEVKRANAVLHGYVAPYDEEDTTYYYEYGPCSLATETCGIRTQAKGPVTEPVETETATKVTRLKPGTTYHYWLVASGPGGTAHGEEQSFKTASGEPEEYAFAKSLDVSDPIGVGINQVNGDVYVSTEAKTIAQFDAAGVLQSTTQLPQGSGETWQLAVDNSGIAGQQGDVYVTDVTNNVVYKFAPSGAKEPADEGELEVGTPAEIGKGSLSEPTGIAVDSSGSIYVASSEAKVLKFSSTGVQLNAQGVPGAEPVIQGLSGVRALAVDGQGDIYVAGTPGTVEYAGLGICIRACTPIIETNSEGLALDAAGDLFISNFVESAVNKVSEFSSATNHPAIQNLVLEKSGTFGSFTRGLAVNAMSRALYVAERGGAVKEFTFRTVKPVVVKTEPATQVGGAVESLNGTVNPGGQEAAEYYFEYGTAPCGEESCGTPVREHAATPLNGDEPIPVSVRLEGLAPNTTYHYWIVGMNEESGVEHGQEQTFTTAPEAGPLPPGDQTEYKAPSGEEPSAAAGYPALTDLAPVPGPKAAVTKPLTRDQKLQKALNACRRDKKRSKRQDCEKAAHKAFGPKHKPKNRK